ncbi:helix-turn-helix transcriptional regulator [Erythrobacter sp. QSSC1-22B]|uniref:helix-turn-helix transcriptional regulator n=1 Tax=Erythrobacter sp. QSSC1-22B TaxID=1860125 RepID=UPI0008052E76|nr:helix-turn-helix transcriptional regulator [Erythrobacter sp. QSSC1-22B]OBX18607.1 helix-turn-helix transcriptional regulator [Erythrobacter sp. QSSC1-22B]
MSFNDQPNQLSDFLLELYHDVSEFGPDELRRRVLRNLQDIVPFDFAVWGGGLADGRLVTDLTVLDQSPAVLGEWESVAERDAFCDITLGNLGTTARFDDVPNYRADMAYNEHWRRFGASQMMATIVSEQSDGYVSFVGLCAADRHWKFTEDQRAFKQMLMPHLSQAMRVNRELWGQGDTLEHEAVALVGNDGTILSVQGPFRDLAQNAWGGRVASIPREAMASLRRAGRWEGDTVRARMSPFGSKYFVHLSVVSVLTRLSRRESQVAELFASGLSGKQVARELGTAPSTVRNQIVRIYEKLGVSNKAALASLISRDQS